MQKTRTRSPRATTANEDRYLFLSAKRQRTATTNQLSKDLVAATGSRKTVSRDYERGLYASKPAICITLTPTKERVQNGAENTRIGHSFNGLMFSSPMKPDSVYNVILDGY